LYNHLGYFVYLQQNEDIMVANYSNYAIELEEKYGAHNYHPLPVVLSKGKGVHLASMKNISPLCLVMIKCYL
jgi:hypothetical protein